MSKIDELINIIDKSIECDPWMRNAGIKGYAREMVSEAEELVEAADSEDIDHMKEELADVLREVIIISRFAKIDIDDIIDEIIEKIKRRQPYVLEGRKVTKDEAVRIWKEAKKKEKDALR